MMRGQAFDVFKLMIAAVVAVAILTILMSLLGQITIPGAKPEDMMKNLLSKSKGLPGTTSVSDGEAKFTTGTEIAASSFYSTLGGGKPTITFVCDPNFFTVNAKETSACDDSTTGSLKIHKDFSTKLRACCNSGSQLTCAIGIGPGASISCSAS